jgi:hypothetical protein
MKKNITYKKSQQHPEFPSGLPSKYYLGQMLLKERKRKKKQTNKQTNKQTKNKETNKQTKERLCSSSSFLFNIYLETKWDNRR